MRMLPVALILLTSIAGCATAPPTDADRAALNDQCNLVVTDMQRADANLGDLMHAAWAYAVFPSVGKAAAGLGGAYGRGELFEHGTAIGYTDVKQFLIGPAAGGEDYSEILIFHDQAAMQRFQTSPATATVNGSVAIAAVGEGATAGYDNGVLSIISVNGGAMFEGTVGTQQFTYESMPPSH